MTLETGIALSQAIWLYRVRHVRSEAKKLGMTYDEYVAAHPSKKLERTLSSETVADVEAGPTEAQLPEKSTSQIPNNNTVEPSPEKKSNNMVEEVLTVPETAVHRNNDHS